MSLAGLDGCCGSIMTRLVSSILPLRMRSRDIEWAYPKGDENPSAMWMFLASLAACDVEVVATHAPLLGIEIEHLEIEAKGHFDIHRLLGLDGPPPGYDKIGYTIRLRARGAATEKIEALRRVCERASPVGDSMSKAIPLKLEIEAA
jgi:uncharacterized OsmC-like protein